MFIWKVYIEISIYGLLDFYMMQDKYDLNDATCMLCDSSNIAFWGKGSTFIRCNNCEICYRYNMPSVEELNEIYFSCYSKNNILAGSTSMSSGNKSLANQVAFISRLIKAPAKILDFGAGTGELIKILSDEGYIVRGCEFSKNARNKAKNSLGFDLYSSVEGIQEKFDLIVGIEVIEHLLEPQNIMIKLYDLLEDHGAIYITTPNTNGIQARVRKSHWREAIKPFHLVLFNYKSIKILMKKIGFKRVKYIRFSPLTTNSKRSILHRILQLLGLYGGLRVVCYKG